MKTHYFLRWLEQWALLLEAIVGVLSLGFWIPCSLSLFIADYDIDLLEKELK